MRSNRATRLSRTQKIRRAAIETLEQRRMLFTVNGTEGNDIIEIDYRPVGFLVEYDVTVNGVHHVEVGASGGNSYAINGLGGDDHIKIRRVHSEDFADLDPGPGNDTIDVAIGSFTADVQGQLLIRQEPNEGNDTLFVNDAVGGSNEPIRVDKFRIFAGDGEIFHGEDLGSILLRVASRFAELHEVYVLETPANMTIDMGNIENPGFVTFGDNHVLESTARPMTIMGANLVRFDDSEGPGLRTFDITPTSVFGKTLIDVKAVQFMPRGDNGNAPYTFNLTGNPVDFLTLESCAGFVNIGSFAAPVDLEDIDGSIDNRVRGSTRLFDQAGTGSNNPFLLQTLALSNTNQSIRKGDFNMTMKDGDIDLEIREFGSNGTVFNIAELAVDSTVRIFGGPGGDTLRTTTTANNNHLLDLDDIFVGESFFFDGRQGDNFLELNDINGNTQFGNPTYRLQQGKLVKNGQELLSYNPVTASRIFLAGSSDNDAFFFGGAPGTRVTLNGGAGNDLFSTFDQDLGGGNLPLEGMNASIFGGTGFDAFTIDDTAGAGVDRFDVTSSAVSYLVGSVTSTMAYNGIESMQIFQGSGPAATNLNVKASTLQLLVDCGAGNDTVVAGGGDWDANGFTLATTTVHGGNGTDVIEYQDANDFASDTYTWGTSSLARGTFGFNASSFETRTLRASNGLTIQAVNTINLNACESNVISTTIFGGGGGAGFAVVNVTQGTLANLFGSLDVNLSGGSSNTLNINDQNATGATSSYEVNNIQVRKTSTGQTINYSGVGQMTLNARDSATILDVIDIKSTPAGMSLTVNANAGNDNIFFGNGNVDVNVLGPITINAGSGTDFLGINNSLDTTPETLTLNAASFIDNGITYAFTGVEGTLTVNLGPGATNLTINGTPTNTNVNGGSGDDTFTVGGGDIDANFPATVGKGLFISAAGGVNSLRLDDLNDTNVDLYIFQQAQGLDQFVKRDGANEYFVTWQGISSVTLDASNAPAAGVSISTILVNSVGTPLRINGNGGPDAVQVADSFSPVTVHTGLGDMDNLSVNSDLDAIAATVVIDQSDDIENLSIFSGGTLRVTSGAVVTKTRLGLNPSLTINGVLDLAGGALLSRAGGPTPAQFRTQIIAGRNGGAWNGTNPAGAINSSLAASTPISDGVGYGLGSEIAVTTIGGFSVASGDTLLRYTLDGDADLNQQVNLNDFNRLAANFGQSNKVWVDGDSNFDGLVNLADFNALAGNFGQALAAEPFGGSPIHGARSSDELRKLLQELT